MGFISNLKRKISKDGTKVDVINYKQEDRKLQPVTEAGKYLEEMDKYINGIFPCKDAQQIVYHEIVSDIVHIDVNVIPPDGDRDYYVLWTSGMSDLPMSVPGDGDKLDYDRAELFMFLPKEWQFDKFGQLENGMPNEYYWPVYWMKYLARFPHEYHTWLGVGHTIPNSADYDPLGEGTKMGGFFLLPVISLGDNYPGVAPLVCKDGQKINFFWMIPMYKEEIEFKLEEGFEPMLDLLTEKQFPRVLDPKRENMKG